MLKQFSRKPVAAALLAAGLATAGLPAAASAIQEKVTVSAQHEISPQDEAVISSAAGKVLRHIAQARSYVNGEKADPEAAKGELEQAQKLLDIVRAALPTSQVKDRIWVAKKHLEYESTDEVLPDLVPIYANLDELVDYLPTEKARAHLDSAKKELQKGDKQQAQKQLTAADDELVYVEVDLPITSTGHLVEQAMADLAKGDMKGANEALVSAEQNIVFFSVAVEAPLTSAQGALWRASRDYALGDTKLAKADLDQAVGALERSAQSGDQTARQEVGKLLEQVRDLHVLLADHDKDFEGRAQYTWQRAKALSERAAEYVSTGWERFRSKNEGKKELIDAKLYLRYAYTDHYLAKDDAAAKVELAEAEGYLGEAAARVNAATGDEVKQISAEVQALKDSLDNSQTTQAVASRFDSAQSELGKLIRKL
jgi:hypothetical protein